MAFEPDNPLPRLADYFGFKQALEDLVGRTVDLIAAARLTNPYLRIRIDQNRQNVFAA